MKTLLEGFSGEVEDLFMGFLVMAMKNAQSGLKGNSHDTFCTIDDEIGR